MVSTEGLKKEQICVWYLQPEDFNNKEELEKKGSMIFACKVNVLSFERREKDNSQNVARCSVVSREKMALWYSSIIYVYGKIVFNLKV